MLRNTSLQWSVDSQNLTSHEDCGQACCMWWTVWMGDIHKLSSWWLCIWFCSEIWFPRLIKILFFIEAQIIKRREDWGGPGLWPFWLMHSYYVVDPMHCSALYITKSHFNALHITKNQFQALYFTPLHIFNYNAQYITAPALHRLEYEMSYISLLCIKLWYSRCTSWLDS